MTGSRPKVDSPNLFHCTQVKTFILRPKANLKPFNHFVNGEVGKACNWYFTVRHRLLRDVCLSIVPVLQLTATCPSHMRSTEVEKGVNFLWFIEESCRQFFFLSRSATAPRKTAKRSQEPVLALPDIFNFYERRDFDVP